MQVVDAPAAAARGPPFTFIDLDRDVDAVPVLANPGVGEGQLRVV